MENIAVFTYYHAIKMFTLGVGVSISFDGVNVFFLAGDEAAAAAGGRPGFFFEAAVEVFAFAMI